MAANTVLFEPLTVGDIKLSNRIALAPLTRFRNSASHSPKEPAVEYYAQRAEYEGTLLITEATFVDAKAGSYSHGPGLYTPEHVEGWKKVVEAVHAKGSHIYLQLWALGRAADPKVLKEETGSDVVSSSDVAFEGGAKPRPLTKEEIADFVGYYARCAKMFVEECGGDGVEIHGANGYLLDQFLQTTANKRTDEFGGSIENRARFPLQVVDAVVKAVGAKKTGIRLSPYSTFQGMKMDKLEDIHETFTYFVNQIKDRHPDFAYIHAVESRIGGNDDVPADEKETLDFLYDIWTPRPFLVAGGFKQDNAVAEAEKFKNSVIVFGRYFISNPDLVQRVKEGVPFADYDRSTFYVYGPENTHGYTDYPKATGLKN
ncbi:alkene reductase [Sporobolomyces salmoneus]|uniref:alkene reductase n=1 Tax=Sporobolomyces salmoneus TaxID=183962 RepID=UPI00316F7E6E